MYTTFCTCTKPFVREQNLFLRVQNLFYVYKAVLLVQSYFVRVQNLLYTYKTFCIRTKLFYAFKVAPCVSCGRHYDDRVSHIIAQCPSLYAERNVLWDYIIDNCSVQKSVRIASLDDIDFIDWLWSSKASSQFTVGLCSQSRWLSGMRRSHVHSLMIARRSLCPEKLGSNPGKGSKGINFSGWHGLDMSITVTKRR